MLLLVFMSQIGGSDWEGVVGFSKGVEDVNVKEGTLSVVRPEVGCNHVQPGVLTSI